jgi:hypothetical protein
MGGTQWRSNFNVAGYGRFKHGIRVIGCDYFQRGRGRGGEAAPRCQRWTGRLKAATDV